MKDAHVCTVQDRITHFYNCVGCLMTEQLQSLALESIESFTNLLVQPPFSVLPFEHSGLIVRVLLEKAEIKYEPTFTEFEVCTCLLHSQYIIVRKDIKVRNTTVCVSQDISPTSVCQLTSTCEHYITSEGCY